MFVQFVRVIFLHDVAVVAAVVSYASIYFRTFALHIPIVCAILRLGYALGRVYVSRVGCSAAGAMCDALTSSYISYASS